MGKFTTTNEFNGALSKIWELLLDDVITAEVYLQDLGYAEWAVADRQEGPEQTTRRVAMQPKRELPGPLAKLFGSGYRETEKSTFSTSERTWHWKRIPSTMADKIRMEGAVRFEELGPDRSRVISEISVEAKIFGVGGLFESSFEKSYREEMDRLVASLSKR
ncbi:DUF2505 family protein [Streptomyces sp. NPDC001880]